MNSISTFLAPDHTRCDNIFAAAESAVASGNWSDAAENFAQFQQALLHHFAMEEGALFPAFDARTGMSMGPTATMRLEHRQMTDLVAQMADAMQQHSQDQYLGLSETLLMIMQQHNLKEEQMLYRMADQILAQEVDQVIENMRNAVA